MDAGGIRDNAFRKPERAMATILRSKTLDEWHLWHTVSSETPVGPKSLRLDRSAFQASVGGRSLPLQEIASHEVVASRYSPKSEC